MEYGVWSMETGDWKGVRGDLPVIVRDPPRFRWTWVASRALEARV